MPSSKPMPGESLAELRPDLAAEWNTDKNDGLTSLDVKPGSTKRVWWKCSQGHEWPAIIHNRSYGSGCPYCGNQSRAIQLMTPDIGESLAEKYPNIAKEWHPTKNGDIKPTDVRAGSHKKVWWKCSKDHEWQATVHHRSIGRGCPYCSSQGTSYGEQYIYWALKQLYPDAKNRFKTTNKVEYDIFIPSIKLAIEYSGTIWHEDKEERDKYKRELAESNGIRFIDIIEDWDCISPIIQDNHFEYNSKKNREESLQAIIEIIVNQYNHSISEIDFDKVKQNAVEYSKGKIEYEKSLEFLYPNIAREWDYSKNYGLTPKDVLPGSNKKVWWQCSKGHEWQATINSRSNGCGCPYCAKGSSSVNTGENDLATTNPQLAAEWHPTKNGDLKPTDVRAGSHKKVWWKCSNGHEWEADIHSRVAGSGCPYCKGTSTVLIGENDLATTNPQLAAEWHPTKNGDLKPTDFKAGSGKKVWWKCSKGHEWQATVGDRSKGHGCPYCAGRREKEPFIGADGKTYYI